MRHVITCMSLTLSVLGFYKSSFLFAKSLRLSRNSNSKNFNERTGRLLTSVFHTVSFLDCIWSWIDVALAYGVDFIQHAARLLLLHNVHQILCRIVKKFLKAFILLHYLCYVKSPFLKNSIRALQLNLYFPL